MVKMHDLAPLLSPRIRGRLIAGRDHRGPRLAQSLLPLSSGKNMEAISLPRAKTSSGVVLSTCLGLSVSQVTRQNQVQTLFSLKDH